MAFLSASRAAEGTTPTRERAAGGSSQPVPQSAFPPIRCGRDSRSLPVCAGILLLASQQEGDTRQTVGIDRETVAPLLCGQTEDALQQLCHLLPQVWVVLPQPDPGDGMPLVQIPQHEMHAPHLETPIGHRDALQRAEAGKSPERVDDLVLVALPCCSVRVLLHLDLPTGDQPPFRWRLRDGLFSAQRCLQGVPQRRFRLAAAAAAPEILEEGLSTGRSRGELHAQRLEDAGWAIASPLHGFSGLHAVKRPLCTRPPCSPHAPTRVTLVPCSLPGR